MSSFADQRRNMVDCQLRTFDVFDRAVLAAMNEVAREAFVPAGRENLAYVDQNLALGSSSDDRRVMLAPMVLGRMIQELDVETTSRVLDVGSGLGYSSAIFARLGATVTALESDESLAEGGKRNLASAGFGSVHCATGPLDAGVTASGPFDIILINGAVEVRPAALLDQLADGGRLACLSAESGAGKAILFVRSGSAFGERRLFDAVAPVLTAFRRVPSFQF